MEGCNPQENRSAVTSSGSAGVVAFRPHFTRTIETPLCVRSRHLLSSVRPSLHPAPFVSPSLWALLVDSSSQCRLSLHPSSCVCMCLCVSTRLFACTRVISLRVYMFVPETPAPPRWAWSPGPARRTRQPLNTHTARTQRLPRIKSSTPTNSAWTHSGVR